MKRTLFLIISTAVVVLATFYQFPNKALAEASGKRVALLVGPTQDVFIGTWAQTFAGGAEKAGMKVSVFSSPFDPALQVQQLDDAIAQKFDMIVIQTISQQAVLPALQRAKVANVPVVTIISQFPEGIATDLYVTYVGENSVQLGELAAEALGNLLKVSGREAAKVAAITGSIAEGVGMLRMNGFKNGLKKFPGVTLIAEQDVKWNPIAGEKAAGQTIARFAAQGGLDAMYGMNDTLANSIIQAAESAGVKLGAGKGEMIVVGGNCQASGIKNFQAGKESGTILMLPSRAATLAVEEVEKIFDGRAVPKAVYETHEIITKDNLAKHADDCSY
jgi:ribose transport system substrate-binding protein